MSINMLVELELANYNWHALQIEGGSARTVPSAIREMLSASSEEEAESAYWKLENFVVVDGRLHDSAGPVVSVLLAALTVGDLSDYSTMSVLELLTQILIYNDRDPLRPECRRLAREGLWLFYREAIEGDPTIEVQAFDILKVLDPSPRLQRFESYIDQRGI